jgi:hypothetical protein
MAREDFVGGDAAQQSASPQGQITFLDSYQVHWRVFERDARNDAGTKGEWCLIFSSVDTLRRVWIYPVDWRTLSSAALTMLSWHR